MYLDESGDHNLVKIDPTYPIFVLGGIIVDRTYARTEMRRRIRDLKLQFFHDPAIVLHTNDILRARHGFESLSDPAVRQEFYEALNVLMTELEYTVVACVIDKPGLIAKYGREAKDPYHYGLQILIDRFCNELGDCVDGGIIYAEKRGEPLDYELSAAWEQIRSRPVGTGSTSGEAIDERICELVLRDKKLTLEGLQLADLVISPIARRAMNLPVKQDWDIVRSKFRRGREGQVKGDGLTTLP